LRTEVGTDIQKAISILESGGLVAIPTETVYGLAANALNPEAVAKIFEVKQRPTFNPLITHLKNSGELQQYASEIPADAILLADAFMPGALTLLLPKKPIIPNLTTSGLPTAAFRVPNHPLTLQLLEQLDFPLAAPSANPFGYISPTTAEHVLQQLGSKIPYILDGGACQGGLESTIVGFEKGKVIVYRIGLVSVEEIAFVLEKEVIVKDKSVKIVAPGMLPFHYAPLKPMILYDSILELNTVEEDTAYLLFDEFIQFIPSEQQFLLSPSGDLKEAAKNLYSFLHHLDNSRFSKITAFRVPDIGIGKAINERLEKASKRNDG